MNRIRRGGAPANALRGLILFGLASLAPFVAGASTPGQHVARLGQPTKVEDIAQTGYVYGFPMVDLYRIFYGYFIDPKSPAYAAPLNVLHNTAQVYTPADKTVQTPNSDTPYSTLGLDLRAEPIVLTLPPIQNDRYYSVQLVDLYTFNVGYLGSRTTGNGGGHFLLVGPNWHHATPPGIDKVVRFHTQFGLALFRTQLFGSSDLANVKKIQAGYAAAPLSAFQGGPVPSPAPSVAWIPPLTPEQERASPQFFNVLAFLLQFAPTSAGDIPLRENLSNVGVAAGKPFVAGTRADAFVAGMRAGQRAIDAGRAASTSSIDLFGTRESMHNDYLNRALGAQTGILGNTAAEALYSFSEKDSQGNPLTGDKRYTVRFDKDALPPVRAFWSLTMYDLPQQLLVANPIDRYLINSPMLPTLDRDPGGGLTLYIQHAAPPPAQRANWLPAPAGPFMMVLRLYWPEEAALSGKWKAPLVVAQ
ncbi:MAG TPA: DUF1254 domain-containing protein [Candidatus Tumulicola sp.]